MSEEEGLLLVVDDNEMNREVLSRRLLRKGYEVIIAEGGKIALELIKEHAFDLVLLDIMMPEINGIDVLKKVRQDYSPIELPVVMVTAKDDGDGIIEALNLGANDYITKPIDFPVAFARVRAQMQCRNAEKALKESEERYRDLFDNAHDLIQIVSNQEQFLYVNQVWKETLGYNQEEIEKFTSTDIIHPDERKNYWDALQRTQQHQGIESFETVLMTKEGESIFVEAGISCRYKNDKHITTRGIFHNITERKKVDQMKNEFISMVSHELRTPLTSIKGSLGLLNGGIAGELSTQAKTLIEIAYNNSERLVRLINDILDIEKIECGKMVFKLENLDLIPIIEQAVESNQGFANQYQVNLSFKKLESNIYVKVDSDRLFQVLTNLLSNAVKYSPSNDNVTIEIVHKEDKVSVLVSDKGPGIPEEFQSRIFGKFSQADSSATRKKGGTGLGLNISKAIIERFKGEIGFQTKTDQGTTFYFTLPTCPEISETTNKADISDVSILSTPPNSTTSSTLVVPPISSISPEETNHATSETQEINSKIPAKTKKHILHLEKDPDVFRVVSQMLENFAEIYYSSTIEESKAPLNHGKFDLIIMDACIEKTSEEELLKKIDSENLGNTPIVFLTTQELTVENSKNVKAILVKSRFSNEKLVQTIKECLNHIDS